MTESKVTKALKEMANIWGFTPRTLADSFDSLINKQLAIIAKEQLTKNTAYKVCYFEMTENPNHNQTPTFQMFGVSQKGKRYLVRDVDFKTEVFDKVLKDSSLGMVNMAKSMFNIDMDSVMIKFYEKINKALNDEMVIKKHPVKVVMLIGKEKINANMSSNKNVFYKKNFKFSELINENETF